MAHFGVLSYKGTGHLNPLISLSKQLKLRGHSVTFFQASEVEEQIHRAGISFFPIKQAASSPDERGEINSTPQLQPSIFSLRNNIRRVIHDMETYLQEVPSALTKAKVDVLLIDEIILSGPTLAQMLHLPYFVISAAVPHRFGWAASTYSPASQYSSLRFSQIKNALLQASVFSVDGPIRTKLDNFRSNVGLGPIRDIQRHFPELAHITQLPQCLDFPRSKLPKNFYYSGPFVDKAARPSTDFPWNLLDGRPLVYASLGTRKNSHLAIFHVISEACKQLNLQLIISLGGRLEPEMLDRLPGQPVVVKYAPQLELLNRAEIVVTHGGLNTTLETLMEGKPMIVLPMAHDQPAIAARLTRLKVAEMLSMEDLSVEQLRMTFEKVLGDTSYRNAAMNIGAKILATEGLERAVQVIEENLERHIANAGATLHSNDGRVTT